jgi:hypothetical protein
VADNDQLVDDLIRLDKAVKIGTPEQVRTICGGLAYDIGTSYDTLPTPDQALTDDLNNADTSFLNAATSCSSDSAVSTATMTADLAKVRAGIGSLLKAQRLLKSLGVTWKIRL